MSDVGRGGTTKYWAEYFSELPIVSALPGYYYQNMILEKRKVNTLFDFLSLVSEILSARRCTAPEDSLEILAENSSSPLGQQF